MGDSQLRDEFFLAMLGYVHPMCAQNGIKLSKICLKPVCDANMLFLSY